jgi:ligand-binding SRPBCC domain-containing protein
MPSFDYTFTVRAPLSAVAEFHRNTRALKRLTPPPVFVRLHRVEPPGEGSVSEFTMWFGPFPTRWVAVHSDVDPLHGFTDTQTEGPLKRWVHTHRFTGESDGLTRIHEHIEYQHHGGLRGLFTRLLFSPPALWGLFTYRRFVTRVSLATHRKHNK